MPQTRPWWKKLLYGLITAAILLALLEAGLALFGVRPQVVHRDPFVGFAPGLPLFKQKTDDGQVTLVTHPDKLTWFNSQSFPLEKLEGTYRIFCLGGSTTYGQPYDDSLSFSAWLRELLPRADDDSRRFEVINAGGISYASYRIARLMEELVRYEPDLFIVYCGHNEFLEERTYRELKRLPEPLLRAAAPLSRTRAYAALHRLVRPLQRETTGAVPLPGEVDAQLDHTVGPELYHRDDQQQRRIIAHYRFNLLRMHALAHAAGAQIVFVTPAANLKEASPFKSEPDQSLPAATTRRWRRLYDRAQALKKSGDEREALELYQQAADLDPRHAGMQFRIGKLLIAQKDDGTAEAAFIKAKDEDVCPLRMLSSMYGVYDRLADEGAIVVDFNARLSETCFEQHGHRIPGEEFFFDHLHLNTAATRLLAVSIVKRLIAEGLLTPSPAWPGNAVEAAGETIESRLTPETRARALRNLAKVLTWAGKHREAGPIALEALETLPEDSDCLFMAGTWYRLRGDVETSVDYFRRALDDAPDTTDVHLQLARVALAEGRTEQARLHYLEVLRLRPGDADARRGLEITAKE